MLPPPPRSPLFPYTTLFRSFELLTTFDSSKEIDSHLVANNCRSLYRLEARALLAHDFKRFIDFLDRKSTRLNSSHLVISYAVFCLKKKKKDNRYLLNRRAHT